MSEVIAKQVDAVAGVVKFRTTPIAKTIKHVKQLPASAIIYKCAASKYWQFRVYLEGTQRKRSTKEQDETKAYRAAKLIYADMLNTIHGDEDGKLNLGSKNSLHAVAKSLWQKQEVMVAQGELNPQKNRIEKYVFERHIRPFFNKYEIKDINADVLEQFKIHLAHKRLVKSTQRAYFTILSKLLQEAVKKQYIKAMPLMPRVRIDVEPRGYFNPTEYTILWKKAESCIGQRLNLYRKRDMINGLAREGAKPYYSVAITKDCMRLILFMRNTYIRPTDIKVLKHKHISFIEKGGFEFLQLKHPKTKRHYRIMSSTEYAADHYRHILEDAKAAKYDDEDDYLFMPQFQNREYALKKLTQQFDAILKLTNLKRDANGRKRTLYSLRHTAIVTGIRAGISIETLAMNARTSSHMIDQFYGSHIETVLDKGTEIIDSVKNKHERYAKIAEARVVEKGKKVDRI
jgi:hypothetical protein